MKAHIRKQGFTLLEIVVAITLLALMALMLNRVFTESNRAVRQAQHEATLNETAHMLLDILEQDLSQALIRTNIPFRVSTLAGNGNDSVYFVSTAARRQQSTLPRETAPMRVERAAAATPGIGILEIVSPTDSSETSGTTLLNLIRHSGYYTSSEAYSVSEFGDPPGETRTVEYTRLPNDNLTDHAVLTSLAFIVNGDPDWQAAPDGTPPADDLPQFIDISLSLVSAEEVRRAQRGSDSTEELQRLQRTFSRRIALPNRGVGPLDFSQ